MDCGRTNLTPQLIHSRHFVCAVHFRGNLKDKDIVPDSFLHSGASVLQEFNCAIGKTEERSLDLSIGKLTPTQKELPKTKYNLYSTQNFNKNDFSEDFFGKHMPELIRRTLSTMQNCPLVKTSDNTLAVIHNLVNNPDDVKVIDGMFKILTSLNKENIREKDAYLIKSHKLRQNNDLKAEVISSF